MEKNAFIIVVFPAWRGNPREYSGEKPIEECDLGEFFSISVCKATISLTHTIIMEECDKDVLKNEEIISNIKGFYKNDAVALVVSLKNTLEIDP